MFERLIAIPDYLTLPEALEKLAEHPVVACASKYPACSYDSEKPPDRRALMSKLMEFSDLTILTPSAGFLSRLCTHDDRCFFVDLTLRLIAAGGGVEISTGMRKETMTAQQAGWIAEIQNFGVRTDFLDKPETAAPEKDLVLAEDVLSCFRAGKRELTCAANAIITPYAWDEARDRGVVIRKRSV